MLDPVRSRRGARIALVAGAVVLLAVLCLGAVRGGQESTASADVSPAAAAAVPPGLQPNVQAWLKVRERKVIDLNNALVPIVQATNLAGSSGKSDCVRVLAAAKAMSAQSKAPDAEVDTLARAGLAKIEQGAAACVAGDTAGGKQLITAGLAERTAATDQFDATLEGE